MKMKTPKSLAKSKVARAMHEMHHGKLHSGSKEGPKVTNPKQAVAIGLNEAREMEYKKKKKKKAHK